MKVEELIDLLSEHPSEMEVFVEYNTSFQMAINPIQVMSEQNIDKKDGGRFIVAAPRGEKILLLEVYND